MARQRMRPSWIQSIRNWFSVKKASARQRRSVRHLAGEALENRKVMSVAPFADVAEPSLAEYLAQAHQMGPIAPAEVAAENVDALASAGALPSINQLLLRS